MSNVDPAAILEGIMPMLRETFPRDKDFLEANRHRLVQIVELALTERRVGRGAPPTTPLEWMEYQVLMTRERKHDLRDDPRRAPPLGRALRQAARGGRSRPRTKPRHRDPLGPSRV
jgi:hypothetical protein